MRCLANGVENNSKPHKKWYTSARNIADKVAYSWRYIIVVAVLALLANTCAAELPVYTAYILIAVGICAFCRDLLPIAPLVVCSYIAPSIANNPGRNPQSIFYPENGGLYLRVLAAVLVVALIIRLCVDPQIGFRKMFRTKRQLIWSMVAMGGAYLLSGIGAQGYTALAGKNIFFGALQFLSIALLYFIFAGSVKWEEGR